MQNLELHNSPVIKENSLLILSFILHLRFEDEKQNNYDSKSASNAGN
jgi:hypothetical protein